jgi:hypothetical protein
MTLVPPTSSWRTLLVKSNAPMAQLVLVIVPAAESIVVVPAASQFQLGAPAKLTYEPMTERDLLRLGRLQLLVISSARCS